MLTKKVPLSNDKNGKNCRAENRNLYAAQDCPDHIVYSVHLPDGGTIRALDDLVFVFFFIADSFLPVDLNDLVPHGNERQDGGDAARRCEERGGIKGKILGRWDDVDVVRGATSHGRERAVVSRASQATQVAVGEAVSITRYGIARLARRRCAPVELDRQTQQAFETRLNTSWID